eukprot:Trichotokara_eunicae@DN5021_c0_g1_i1.p1
MYRRRRRVNPLFNSFIVGGVEDDGTPTLGYVDHQGTYYEENVVATSMASYFSVPLLRSVDTTQLSESEAKELLTKCMTILYGRDCLGHNKIQIAIGTKDGVKIEEPFEIHNNWSYKGFQQSTTDWGLDNLTF